MNGSYDPYPDFSPLYEPTSFSWWLFSLYKFFTSLLFARLLLHARTRAIVLPLRIHL